MNDVHNGRMLISKKVANILTFQLASFFCQNVKMSKCQRMLSFSMTSFTENMSE